jgi:ElaB/YqjD/DUF883 family membrane-anchored ribosome-binding protein
MRLGTWAAVVVLAMTSATFGQTDPNQPPPAPQGRQRGNFDPQQFRQRMEERLKEQLQVNDDEWKALQPKIEKVMEAQRDASGGRGMFRGGRRGGQDQPNNGPTSPVQDKARELQTVLESKDSKPEQIKSALSAYREARATARANLTKAQDELRELLTTRQESVLVMMGMLE